MSRVPLEDIAKALGKDDTAACRVRNGEKAVNVADLAKLISLCGLKLVDASRFCVKQDEFEFMRKMTARALANQAMAEQLTFDDPE